MTDYQDFFSAVAKVVMPFEELFFATALASLRVYAAFLILPAAGEQFLIGNIRAALVFIIAVFIAAGLPVEVITLMSAADWIIYAGKEVLIGLVMGFAASTVFWIAECVGALIDTQSGYNSVQMTNPLSGEQSTPVSSLLLQMIVSVFFILGGMLVFIGALFESFHVWPLFSALPKMSRLPDLFIVQQTEAMMSSVVKFAAPVLLVLMLIDLGIGLITRAADKLEPSNLGQPIKGAVSMLMLALLMGVMITQVKHLLVPTGLLGQIQSTMGKSADEPTDKPAGKGH